MQSHISRGVIWMLFAVVLKGSVIVSVSQDFVELGRTALRLQNLEQAETYFAQAVDQNPEDQRANALLGAARILNIIQAPATANLLDRLWISPAGRNIYDWTAQPTTNDEGSIILPDTVRVDEVVHFFRTNTMPALQLAAKNFAAVTSESFLLALSSAETQTVDVTIDYADILLIRSLLSFVDYSGYTVAGWNTEVRVSSLMSLLRQNDVSAEEVLAVYPHLFTFTSTNDLQLARQSFSEGTDLYFAASELIESRPTNVVRLFNLDDETIEAEVRFRNSLQELRKSLNGPIVFSQDTNIVLHLGRQFVSPEPPREALPMVLGNSVVAGTWPEEPFGGIISGLSKTELDSILATGQYNGRTLFEAVTVLPRFSVPARTLEGNVQIAITAAEGAMCTVQMSSDLVFWETVVVAKVSDGVFSFAAPDSRGEARFYRAVVEGGDSETELPNPSHQFPTTHDELIQNRYSLVVAGDPVVWSLALTEHGRYQIESGDQAWQGTYTGLTYGGREWEMLLLPDNPTYDQPEGLLKLTFGSQGGGGLFFVQATTSSLDTYGTFTYAHLSEEPPGGSTDGGGGEVLPKFAPQQLSELISRIYTSGTTTLQFPSLTTYMLTEEGATTSGTFEAERTGETWVVKLKRSSGEDIQIGLTFANSTFGSFLYSVLGEFVASPVGGGTDGSTGGLPGGNAPQSLVGTWDQVTTSGPYVGAYIVSFSGGSFSVVRAKDANPAGEGTYTYETPHNGDGNQGLLRMDYLGEFAGDRDEYVLEFENSNVARFSGTVSSGGAPGQSAGGTLTKR